MFSENLHGWQESYTTTGRTGRAKYQLCNNLSYEKECLSLVGDTVQQLNLWWSVPDIEKSSCCTWYGVTTCLRVKPNLVSYQTSAILAKATPSSNFRTLHSTYMSLMLVIQILILHVWQDLKASSSRCLCLISVLYALKSFCASCFSLSLCPRRHIEAFVGLIGWSRGQPTLARPPSAFGREPICYTGTLQHAFYPLWSSCYNGLL